MPKTIRTSAFRHKLFFIDLLLTHSPHCEPINKPFFIDRNSAFPHCESIDKLFPIDCKSTFPHCKSNNKLFLIDRNSAFSHCESLNKLFFIDLNSTFPLCESLNKLFFIALNSALPHCESLNKLFFIDCNSASPQLESTSTPFKSPTDFENTQLTDKQHGGFSIVAQTCMAIFYSLRAGICLKMRCFRTSKMIFRFHKARKCRLL